MASKKSTKLHKSTFRQYINTMWSEYTFRNTDETYTVFFNFKYDYYAVHTIDSVYANEDTVFVKGDVNLPSFIVERILKSFQGSTVSEFLDFWKDFNDKYPKKDLVQEHYKTSSNG